MQAIVESIFKGKEIPAGMGQEEFSKFMKDAVEEFEGGGFLQKNALPPIEHEDDLLAALQKEKGKLVVVKYWKRGCLPCLSVAEMYKKAEQLAEAEGLPIAFYSINSKSPPAESMLKHQLISGTPTVQTFLDGREVGREIKSNQFDRIMAELRSRMPNLAAARPPTVA